MKECGGTVALLRGSLFLSRLSRCASDPIIEARDTPLPSDAQDDVLVAGFGRRGHAVGDIPGVRFKICKVAGVALIALYKEKKEKPRS